MNFRMYVLAITLLFPVSLAVALQGQRQDKQDPCPNALTQQEIDRCATEHFQKVDKELNDVYQRIVRNLNATDRENLREAQRSWLKFRDSNCYAQRQFHGGSLAPTVQAFCLRGSTDARIKELIRVYERTGDE